MNLQSGLNQLSIRQLILPAPVQYKGINAEKVLMGEITIYKPVHWDQCWDGSLPCSPYIVYGDRFKINVKQRGKKIEAGFMPIELPAHR